MKSSIYYIATAVVILLYAFLPVMTLINDGGTDTIGTLDALVNGTQPDYALLALEALAVCAPIAAAATKRRGVGYAALATVIAVIAYVPLYAIAQKGESIVTLSIYYFVPFVAMVCTLLALSSGKATQK